MILPPPIQQLFYRYHRDLLDSERHRDIIIPTVLATGSLEDWDWLFRTYGWETLRGWMATPGHALELPPPMECLWTTVLLGTSQQTARWSGGNRRRTVPPEALPRWFPPDLR